MNGVICPPNSTREAQNVKGGAIGSVFGVLIWIVGAKRSIVPGESVKFQASRAVLRVLKGKGEVGRAIVLHFSRQIPEFRLKPKQSYGKKAIEPLTLIAIFAAAFVVKLGEKAADVLGERAAENGGNLLSLLQDKDPDAVRAIERIAQRDALTQQDFVDLEVAQLVTRIQQLANTDSEVKTAVNATHAAVQQQPQAIVNLGQLAEKIAVLNQGVILGQQNTITI